MQAADCDRIVLTFHDEPANRLAALAAGADAFISKDHLTDELIPKVQELIQAQALVAC